VSWQGSTTNNATRPQWRVIAHRVFADLDEIFSAFGGGGNLASPKQVNLLVSERTRPQKNSWGLMGLRRGETSKQITHLGGIRYRRAFHR